MLISKNEAVAGRVVGHVRGLEAEVDVLKHLDHPNIVRYLARPTRLAKRTCVAALLRDRNEVSVEPAP